MSRYESDRQALIEAFNLIHGRDPTLAEAQIIQSIGEKESNFTHNSDPAWQGSFNVGAVQGIGPAGAFQHGDSGPQGSYVTNFKRYNNLVEGAADVVKLVTKNRPTVWKAIKRGDFVGTGIAMAYPDPISKAGVYHQTDPEGYGKSLLANGQKIANALGERFVTVSSNWFSNIMALALGSYVGIKAYRWYKEYRK